MDLLDLPQLAEAAALPLSTARYYRDRFILFVPSVRVGRTIVHPPEAVEVLRAIADHAATGMNAEAIQAALEAIYPVTAISASAVAVGAAPGGTSTSAASASAFGERASAIEAELRELRNQLASAPTAQPQPADFETHLLAQAAKEQAAELARLRSLVESLGAQLAQVASREQLEWIGDVVAAAALRPPQGAVDAAVERRLTEILELLRVATNPARQEGEGVLARLNDLLSRRDQEIREAFNTLVRGTRRELDELRSGLGGVQRAIETATLEPLPFEAPEPMHRRNGHNSRNGAIPSPQSLLVQAQPSRSPRRLGQPLRTSQAMSGQPHEGTGD